MGYENDIELLVIEADSALREQGMKPHQRPDAVCRMLAERFGTSLSIDGAPDPLVEAVHAVYERLYRWRDLLQPPLHVGVFMFRDVFIPIRIPIPLGRARISPVMLLEGELSQEQAQWLFSDRASGYAFFDQVIDLMDFVYGLNGRLHLSGNGSRAVAFWRNAKCHLEGAAATLCGSFDLQCIVQSSCLAVEFALKGALLDRGFTDKQLGERKTFGHNLPALAAEVCKQFPSIDKERISFVSERMPQLVANRYSGEQKSRRELGAIAMNAQFVAGEVLRQFSSCNLRASFGPERDWDFRVRHYPKCD